MLLHPHPHTTCTPPVSSAGRAESGFLPLSGSILPQSGCPGAVRSVSVTGGRYVHQSGSSAPVLTCSAAAQPTLYIPVMMLTYLERYTTGLRYIYCLIDYSNSPLHYCTAKLAPTPTATVSMVPGYVWEEPSARYTRGNRWWPVLVVTEVVV